MTKTTEERCALLERVAKKQKITIAGQAQQIERMWEAIRRLTHRTEQLKGAVPHVKFEEW